MEVGVVIRMEGFLLLGIKYLVRLSFVFCGGL